MAFIQLTKEQAKEKVKELVQAFKENIEQYKLPTYKEAQVRKEFIDPLFSAFGWDVSNEDKRAEQYKEVINEDAIKISGNTKAPDYSFRIGGTRIFFVEAKKPSVKIKDDSEPAFQLRRYAWNSNIPISILTDFEDFAVYDCRIKPNPKDNSSVARILIINFENLLQDFDKLWDVFSKEAVLKGSFDRYVESSKGKKGTSEVDNEFLKEIEGWRDNLAKNIALRNPQLSISELNYCVQKVIDRILFLIICEYRNIEKYEKLREIADKEDIYKNLNPYFKYADEKYNSGIFDFKNDKLTTSLIVDDRVLKEIIINLYYPNSPYDFSVLNIEILGSVYERFLGKTIRLTASHQAKVEEKPEVRKAGGVYYTPEFVVNYIVKNTIGRLIEGKTPKQIEKIRVLDPACGSGTFLVRAYQFLLDYHLEYYMQNPKKYKNEIYQVKENQYLLTTSIRKKILLNNIFGVDIDSQAVEITKLSLLLKVLEFETKESIYQQMKLFQERALPDLDKNIRRGNSLIDSSFYKEKQLTLFKDEEIHRINIFDWDDKERGFSNIMSEGGFDVIIGNPPYIRSKLLNEAEREFFTKTYSSASGTYDIYILFIEKGLKLLKEKGMLSFITPNKYFYSDYGIKIREFINNEANIKDIFNFNEFQVFRGITTYTAISILEKSKAKTIFNYYNITKKSTEESEVKSYLSDRKRSENIIKIRVSQKTLTPETWIFKDESSQNILKKLNSNSTELIKLCYKIYQGFVLTPTEVFPVSIINTKKDTYIMKPIKQDDSTYEIEKDLIVPILKSSDIKRYEYIPKNYYAIFPYKYLNNKTVAFIELKEMKEKYPKTLAYLEAKSSYLKTREKGKWKNSHKWYEFSRNQNFECQKMRKILVPGLAQEARYCIGEQDIFIDQGSYGIILNDKYKNQEYFILGLLNSKLLDFYLKSISGTLSGGYYSYQTKYLSKIPIYNIDLNNNNELKMFNRICEIVQDIIKLVKKKNEQNLDHNKELIERQIHAFEKELNDIVNSVYRLNKEDIETIKESLD